MVCRHSTADHFLASFLAAGFLAAFFAGFLEAGFLAAGFLAAGFFAAGFFAFFAAGFFGFFGCFLCRWLLLWLLGRWLLLHDLLLGLGSLLGLFGQFERSRSSRSFGMNEQPGCNHSLQCQFGMYIGVVTHLVVGLDVLDDGLAGRSCAIFQSQK